jgi:hypothetical protein
MGLKKQPKKYLKEGLNNFYKYLNIELTKENIDEWGLLT